MDRPGRDDRRAGAAAISAVHLTRDDASGLRRHAVTHQDAILVLCVRGRATVELRGRWVLRPGEVLLVPPGEPHRFLGFERFACTELHFCVPCLLGAGADLLLGPIERVRAGASPVVSLPRARRAFVETLCRELLAASDDDDEGQLVRRSLLNLVLHEVGRAARTTGAAASSGVVVDALRFIERHCLRPLTLREVARAVGRSPAYVTSALTRATGRSAGEWIVAHRMAEARQRLLHSDERVDIIAERVGYADATHFIRMFRRAHGRTPAAWRAAHAAAQRPNAAPTRAAR